MPKVETWFTAGYCSINQVALLFETDRLRSVVRWVTIFVQVGQPLAILLSASLYFSKRGAY